MVFFDTNVLLYAVAPRDPRGAIAAALLAKGGSISVQVLNEFASVAQRKLKRSWPEITVALTAFALLLEAPVPITLAIHQRALRIAEHDKLSFYDSLIVAAALERGCATLFTEDMQHGRVIDGKLTIVNPFSDTLKAKGSAPGPR